MLATLILGLATTLVAEFITWLNKKIAGTVLHGDAAWIVAGLVAILAASIKVFYFGGVPADWPTFVADLSTIWAISQVFFLWVVQRFGLDVQSPPAP